MAKAAKPLEKLSRTDHHVVSAPLVSDWVPEEGDLVFHTGVGSNNYWYSPGTIRAIRTGTIEPWIVDVALDNDYLVLNVPLHFWEPYDNQKHALLVQRVSII